MISNESSKPKKFYEMLNKLNGNGLQIQYAFKRQLHSTSNKITNIELIFNNLTNSDIDSVKLVNKVKRFYFINY
jgi:ferritin-like metal-binding protein YciE